MTLMLASVRSLDEALLAMASGADLIDLKEPSQGALGALDHAAVRICVRSIGGRRPVSATIGDVPSMDPQVVMESVERLAATGVDFIKVGFFFHPRARDCVTALSSLACNVRLVAVVFADAPYDDGLIDVLASSGFSGAMLDTALKNGKTLRDWRTTLELETFLHRTRDLGLLSGLAGSLRTEDIAPLLALKPDYLGFRGALCADRDRKKTFDYEAASRIRALIPAHQSREVMTRELQI
jgi:dihydroneopterin aldolase